MLLIIGGRVVAAGVHGFWWQFRCADCVLGMVVLKKVEWVLRCASAFFLY